MQPGIHPTYRPVVFRDVAANVAWLCRSTVATSATITWEDGQEYPLYDVDISSLSHPLLTGTQRLRDAEGRVERFRKKYGGWK